jgi:cellulose synthase/poly-beta-1,6-N-acetylglucosamine synthase-like glycosyltransferase
MDAAIMGGGVAVLNTGTISTDLDDWLYTMAQAGLPRPLKPQGNQIARGRGYAVEQMLSAGWDWLLFVDSDCVPPAEALPTLLARSAGIVAGVVLERVPPYAVSATLALGGGRYRKITLDEIPREGLLPVSTTGMACTLIRRSVLEQLKPPYFRCGQVSAEYLTEDTEFCLRAARETGCAVVLDCEVRVGHITSGVLYPSLDGTVAIMLPENAK